MTQSTILSLVPIDIKIERKGAMYPDTWLIPKSDTITPTNFLVEDGWSRTYLGAERGHMRIPILSFELAKSLVSDYIRSCIAVLEGCEPGIFSVEGKVDDVKKYDKELSLAKVRQLRWFEELIRMADNDWAKSGHKHNVISNLQRDVARLLGLDKEWLFVTKDDTPAGSIRCPSCKSIVDKDAIVCMNCKLILNPTEYKKLSFAGV